MGTRSCGRQAPSTPGSSRSLPSGSGRGCSCLPSAAPPPKSRPAGSRPPPPSPRAGIGAPPYACDATTSSPSPAVSSGSARCRSWGPRCAASDPESVFVVSFAVVVPIAALAPRVVEPETLDRALLHAAHRPVTDAAREDRLEPRLLRRAEAHRVIAGIDPLQPALEHVTRERSACFDPHRRVDRKQRVAHAGSGAREGLVVPGAIRLPARVLHPGRLVADHLGGVRVASRVGADLLQPFVVGAQRQLR